ncbi:MAG: glucose-1-phosphate thymidylyltransferase [Chloroflexi bacterium RBG_13_46_14]|nr:MAG: glucose-1-phosphate thymidylyltransferase [Chloroflexi bacterium RBG_13_46_14]
MKAVIIAAGEGKRMRPLTYNRPKVMLPIAVKPILEHLLVEMKQAGIMEFIIVTGYHEEKIKEYFGPGEKWGVNIEYVTQVNQAGTADAVRTVENFVDDRFLVANGDIIVDSKDIKAIAEYPGNSMSLYKVDNPTGLGTVEVEGGFIKRIHEKVENPPSNLANTALYLFTRDVFKAISQTPLSPRDEYELTDSIQWLVDNNIKVAYRELGRWMDTSYPWDLLSVNEYLLADLNSDIHGEVEENAVLKGAVSVGKGSVIRSGSYISGPVVIGEDCVIGPNCYIRASTSVGNRCHIGAAVEIKNSIIMDGSKVPHLSYVGDSVIGEDCNLGAGTKVANLKLNNKEVSIEGKDTGRRKLGVIMGDGVETGINSSINVGTIIGSNSRIGPGTFVSGNLPPKSRVFISKSN